MWALFLLALAACGDHDAKVDSRPVPTPTPIAQHGDRCAARPAMDVTTSHGVRSVEIVRLFYDRLIVLTSSEGARAIWVGMDGTVTKERALDLPGDLIALERLDTGPAVAVTLDAGNHLRAMIVDESGEATTRELALPSPMRTFRIAAHDSSVFLARSHATGPAMLDRLDLSTGQVTSAQLAPATDETPIEILALAAPAVIVRVGAPEAASSEVRLVTPTETRAVEALHHALAIEGFEDDLGVLSAVASFEFSRPSLLRIQGEEVTSTPIPMGRPPAPFTEHLRARLDHDGEHRFLRVVDAAGDPVERALPLGQERPEASDVARDGMDAFVTVFTHGDHVMMQTVHCPW